MQKLTALVTGANKGIGFETARQLAQRGLTVWLGCRDEDRGVTAAKKLEQDGDVRFVRLDVTDEASVKAAAARIEKETGALDVLVNNAAIAEASADRPPSTIALDVIQRTFDANFYGVLRVTQALLPLVKRARAGRIVNVSSTMGSITSLVAPDSKLRAWPTFAYGSSKTALNAITGWLSVELEGSAVKVNSVCPGYNATDLNDNQGTLHPSEGAKVVVHAATLGEDGPNGAFLDVNGTVPW